MSTTTSPLAGTYNADPVHSNFGFAVRYQGVSLFKGTLDEVSATLVDGKLEGTAKVEGELTIKGITRPITAAGTWIAPDADAFGNTRGHLNLEAEVDRTAFGLNWNMDLPAGGKVLANNVTLTVDASLIARAEA